MITEKLLTVSVAAYNGAETLAKALDSCLVKGLDLLEILVVDDGSTDDTAAIAQQYVQKYPDAFRLIQKENGGYGTTINRTIAEARGLYYRTLDCDDWFSRPALQTLLEELQNCKADAVVTNYQTVCNGAVQNRYCVCDGFTQGVLYESSSFQEFPCMEMHALTFRTEVLRRAGIDLPAHCNYTDMLYTFCAMAQMRTVTFCPVTLYNYLLGRDGQSVSLESYRKHIREYMQVTEQILERAIQSEQKDEGKIFLLRRAVDVEQELIEIMLQFSAGNDVLQMLKQADSYFVKKYGRILKTVKCKNTRLLRATAYKAYWLLQIWSKRFKRERYVPPT